MLPPRSNVIFRDYHTAIKLSQAQAIIGCSKRTLYRLRDEGLLVTWPVSAEGRERRTSVGHALDAREALSRINPPPLLAAREGPTGEKPGGSPTAGNRPKSQAELSRSLYR